MGTEKGTTHLRARVRPETGGPYQYLDLYRRGWSGEMYTVYLKDRALGTVQEAEDPSGKRDVWFAQRPSGNYAMHETRAQALAFLMPRTYTAIGYWNDADGITLVGIVRGEHPVFGFDYCSVGGPWATSFEAEDDEDAEGVAQDEATEAEHEIDEDPDEHEEQVLRDQADHEVWLAENNPE